MTKVILKSARISPRKARLLANVIRGLRAEEAENTLQFSPTKAAKLIRKLLKSALAAAKNQKEDSNNLVVSEIRVDSGAMLKRRKARSRGRADLIKKRTSHITIVLSEAADKKESVKTLSEDRELAKKENINKMPKTLVKKKSSKNDKLQNNLSRQTKVAK